MKPFHLLPIALAAGLAGMVPGCSPADHDAIDSQRNSANANVSAGTGAGVGAGVGAKAGGMAPLKPARIVSLNPCADAILAEIAPEQLLAISHYSHDPRSSSMDVTLARKWPAMGGSAEEVIALSPDLVMASEFLAPATRQALADAGLRVEFVGNLSNIAEAKAQIDSIGKAVQRETSGAQLIARIDDALADARRQPAKRPTALFWQSGGIVPGDGALISDVLRHAGFENHSAARGLGQGAYLPLEAVLADPPDLIISAGGDRALSHPALLQTSQSEFSRFDPTLTFCGGPTIIKAADRLSQIFDQLEGASL